MMPTSNMDKNSAWTLLETSRRGGRKWGASSVMLHTVSRGVDGEGQSHEGGKFLVDLGDGVIGGNERVKARQG